MSIMKTQVAATIARIKGVSLKVAAPAIAQLIAGIVLYFAADHTFGLGLITSAAATLGIGYPTPHAPVAK